MKKIFINGGIFALSLILPAIVECRKYNNAISPQITTTAIIVDSGPIAADGCGWLIKDGDKYYHPKSLDSKYQVNNLRVSVIYEILADKFNAARSLYRLTTRAYLLFRLIKLPLPINKDQHQAERCNLC